MMSRNTCFLIALIMAGATNALAQGNSAHDNSPRIAQIVALDECDPATFNAPPPDGVGPDFCRNVTLGAFTTLSDLFAEAAAGHPDPKWDFEPDVLTVKEGATVKVTDQGGEPHTFTEVANFGGGFIPGLNAGQDTAPECSGGFGNVAVARTRLVQGSTIELSGLSKGKHHFQCCIHPWMHVDVDVK